MRKYHVRVLLAGIACVTALTAALATLPLLAGQNTAAPATVAVVVPADAIVTFDGNPTKEKGTERQYATPPLAAGKTFHYTIVARWTVNGQPVEKTRRVDVTSGATVRVDFLRKAAEDTVARGSQEKTAHALPPEEAKAIKAWGRSNAVYAATYGSSIVAMYNLRETVAVGPNAKVRPNELWRLPNITTPKIAQEAGYVTPNVNTVYGFGFLDLSQEPIVITAPDSEGRYYMIELIDMWNNAFAYAAGKKVGYTGGKFAVVGPGWKGELPQGLKRIDAPTPWVAVQPRIHVKDQGDLPGAQKVLAAITLQGLAQYQGKPAPTPLTYKYETPRLEPKVASSQLRFEDPMQFWSIFAAAMNENPPPKSQIEALLPNFKALGIEFGKPWDPKKVNPLVLEQMKVAGAEIGPMMNRIGPIAGPMVNGWNFTPYSFGNPGADYLLRGINAVLGLTANITSEAFYILGTVDSKGEPLTGKNKYTITFPAALPYTKVDPPGFWSVTMYDGATKLTVENPINRYSLGSDNKMQKNADGTFTMYLQAASPGKDKESNWLPCPEGPFYLLLRNYGPAASADAALRNPADMKLMPPIVPFGAR